MRIKIIIALFIQISLFQGTAYCCNEISVVITGLLSTNAKMVYTSDYRDLAFDDNPAITIPLNKFDITDTQLSLRLTRTNIESWRLDIYNAINGNSPPDFTDYYGPISNILFDTKNKQSDPINISVPLSSIHDIDSATKVTIVIKDLVMGNGNSDLRIISLSKRTTDCSEFPKIVYRKTKPDEEHDEFNPLIAQDSFDAYLR